MRRPAHSSPLTILFLLAPLFVAACGFGGRDAHDIAADFEGTVSATTAEHLLHDVDLQHSPVTVMLDHAEPQSFGPSDQASLEAWLHDALASLQGMRVTVTQQVIEDTGPSTQQLTLTLAVDPPNAEREFVPVAMDLVRDGKRVLIARVRVMAPSH